MTPRLARALAILAAAPLAACSSLRPPEISVSGASVAGSSDEGITLAFTLDAANASAAAIPLREVRYDVFLDGRLAFSGYRSPEATLRRFGVQQLYLPAAIPAAGIGRPVGPVRYELRGEIVYQAPGAFAETLFDAELMRPTAAFSGAGTIDFVPGK